MPITGQTFAVLLVGASLGTVRGLASLVLYVGLGVAGAPIYADHAHGWSVVTSASGGYLVGFALAAALVGYLAERHWDRRFSSSIGAMLTGNVVIYLVGLPWLAVVLDTNLEKTLEYGLYPFIPGDVFKLYLAAILLPRCLAAGRQGRPEVVTLLDATRSLALLCEAMPRATANSNSIRPFFFYARAFSS